MSLFRNRELQKVSDFSGLKWGKVYPTDIDAFMDINDDLFVFVETKYDGARVPYGQKLALERLTDATNIPPSRMSVCLIASHNDEGDIDMGAATVTEYRFNGSWREPSRKTTVRQAVEIFLVKMEEMVKSRLTVFK